MAGWRAALALINGIFGDMNEPPATALIAMCKAPEPGRTKTRLSPPLTPLQASRLYVALLADTLDLIEVQPAVTAVVAITPARGLAYFEALERPRLQLWPIDGADIGICLHFALGRALAEGYDYAIAINSDGPTMPPERIDAAVQALRDGADVALGPSTDGGYYLIGLRRPQPRLLCNDDPQFDDITWSTDRVLQQTLLRASHLGLRAVQLPLGYDVDVFADLQRLAQTLLAFPQTRCIHTRAWLQLNEELEIGKQTQ